MRALSKRNIFYIFAFIGLGACILSFAGKDVNPAKEDFEPYEVESCGVERWSVKVLSDPAASSVNIIPVNTTIKDLVHLVTPSPDPNMPRQDVEKQLYTVHCTVGEVKLESDGDYHLLLRDSAGNTMIGEIPDPTCPATASSLYLGDITRSRQYIDKYYHVTSSFQNVNKRFVVTGVAFVDPPHGQTDAAPNNLELHSILDIEFEPTHTSAVAENAVAESHITVFPNPIIDEATFRLGMMKTPFQGPVYLRIFDMAGREVKMLNWPQSQSSLTFDRGQLKSGVYFYRLTEGDHQSAAGKIMLQ